MVIFIKQQTELYRNRAGAVNYITSIGKLSRSGMRNRETRGQDIPEIYSIEKGTVKHRYVYFLGNKTEKKEMLKMLKYPIEPYPKGKNIRYDASYTPITQGSFVTNLRPYQPITLRPYQKKAVQDLWAWFERNPTGDPC